VSALLLAYRSELTEGEFVVVVVVVVLDMLVVVVWSCKYRFGPCEHSFRKLTEDDNELDVGGDTVLVVLDSVLLVVEVLDDPMPVTEPVALLVVTDVVDRTVEMLISVEALADMVLETIPTTLEELLEATMAGTPLEIRVVDDPVFA
jgi:hypothetical protein